MSFLFFLTIIFPVLYGGGLGAQTNYFIHVGHSTVFIHIDNVNILTDPNWNNYNLFIERDNPPAVDLKNLAPADIILISHGHFDHMDLWTLKKIHKINPHVKIFLPVNLGYLLRQIGITNYRELKDGEETTYKNILIKTYKADHNGSRFLFDKSSLALCYLISSVKTIFFSGDTAFSGQFKKIGEEKKIDIAFIEIQGWKMYEEDRKKYSGCMGMFFKRDNGTEDMTEPIPRHVKPQQAVQIMLDLKAEKMVPIHYDAFFTRFRKLRDETDPLEELRMEAKEKNAGNRILILKLGSPVAF